jgi:hypothetical protein
MELNLEFSAANDMIAVLSAQMRGLGFWTNVHVSKLDIGGKVHIFVIVKSCQVIAGVFFQ